MTPSNRRAQSAPPLIDGVLDDAAWREAQADHAASRPSSPISARTRPSTPRPAWPTTPKTCTSPSIALTVPRKGSRPPWPTATRSQTDDFVCINLDSFNDQQAIYAFYVNPLGIQGDSRFAGSVEDFSADFVWSSAGRLGPDGYAVEMRIPFKSIRYAGKERVEMAIFFERYISRTNEHGSFPEMDPAKGYAFLSQMQPLELRDIRRTTLLEVLPSLVFNQRHEQREGRLQRSESRGEPGVTAKLGLTSKLILDLTWNPDFSQVESDAGQVDANLRSDLFSCREEAVLPGGR